MFSADVMPDDRAECWCVELISPDLDDNKMMVSG